MRDGSIPALPSRVLKGAKNMEDIYFIQGSIEMRDNEEAEPWMIENWFCNFLSECCPECIMEDPQDHTFSFGFHGTGSYPEEDILAFLSIIEPYTISGEITYTSEADETYFRHFYDKKKKAWVEQEGWIEYEKVGEPISAIISRKGLNTFSYDEFAKTNEFDLWRIMTDGHSDF